MPVCLALTTGEAHDNRLVTLLLSDLNPGAILLADRGRAPSLIGGRHALLEQRAQPIHVAVRRNQAATFVARKNSNLLF